ncbi:CD209 antigen-like protein E [Acanthochromis polyacanthus]|uniref:CD209 antigen-like protein E n=1 Tax=Acanthochromis polyacanthus TaxID=80966 RepID=UPI002234123C|nr:CD209 antigen-like protein E [Acanthochromis polyacanthus]
MSEVIYSKLNLSKNVRFQRGKKEDGNADLSDNTYDVTIYDNNLAEESTTPKREENLTEDQQQITVTSEKRKFLRVAAVFLGLLCLLLLAAVIVLLVLLIQDKSSWNTERRELMTNIAEMQRLSASLSKLQEQFDAHFQQGWVHFNHSFYYISSMKKTWEDSRNDCMHKGTDLVVIDSEEEQNFTERFAGPVWIGLKYKNEAWKWVDETPLTQSDWLPGEPNGAETGEHCAEILHNKDGKGWNDARCADTKTWICEKKVAL